MTDENINLCDYAVAFVDLLGQRAAMPGRHLPPNSEEAIALVKKSVGCITGMQKLFEEFYGSYTSDRTYYSELPQSIQSANPDMAPAQLKWQYFSDGLVIYVPLGSGMVPSPVNSLQGMLLATGMLCLLGLAGKSPIRAGIDVAWGVEYRPNELYGAAVAHAYKLESEVAKWPRVVVGEGLVSYLQHYSLDGDHGASSQFRRKMASSCLKLLDVDIDGNHIVDYLGNGYRMISRNVLDKEVVEKAQTYIEQQIVHWRDANDLKLLERYETLRAYISHRMAKN